MRWLSEGSVGAVGEALRVVAPELSGLGIVLRETLGEEDPEWWAASAMVGEEFVVKFAWSRQAAVRVAHEIDVLAALGQDPGFPYLPEVVASSTDPVLLVTRRVPGSALFDIVDSMDRDDAGRQLATFLAALHELSTLERVERLTGRLSPVLLPPATTAKIREKFTRWVRPDQVDSVLRWCDWTDGILVTPAPQVLAHGDLHGGNEVWYDGNLQAVIDYETTGLADPEYDLRCFPGTGPGVELLQSTLDHYHRQTTRHLSLDRAMAWHVRTALGDALWRTEANVPLPDHRTPTEWVDDLTSRFAALGINP